MSSRGYLKFVTRGKYQVQCRYLFTAQEDKHEAATSRAFHLNIHNVSFSGRNKKSVITHNIILFMES